MAPRRGGGGGSYGSAHISCDSDAFEDQASRVEIAFAALWFVVSVVLFFVATRRFGLNKKQGSPVVGSVFLGFSIFLALGGYLTLIIYTAIIECGTMRSHIWVASIVYGWLYSWSVFILTALTMTTICRKLQSDFARVQPFILTLQTVWVGVLAILMAALLSMNTAYFNYIYSDFDEEDKADDLVYPLRGVRMTYGTVVVAGLLIASATMLKALFSAPAYVRKGSITTWVSILVFSSLGYSVTGLALYIQSAFFIRTIYSSDSSYNSYIHGQQAGNFLASFFYFVAFYAALKIASHRSQPAVHADPNTSMNPTAVPSHAPQNYTLNHGYDSHLSYGANGYAQNQTQAGTPQPNQGYGSHQVRY